MLHYPPWDFTVHVQLYWLVWVSFSPVPELEAGAQTNQQTIVLLISKGAFGRQSWGWETGLGSYMAN